jgi:hypothetical protein
MLLVHVKVLEGPAFATGKLFTVIVEFAVPVQDAIAPVIV